MPFIKLRGSPELSLNDAAIKRGKLPTETDMYQWKHYVTQLAVYIVTKENKVRHGNFE
jgi:hypothetical protein